MKVKYLIFILVAFLTLDYSTISAQVSVPSLRCISVDGSQIKLDWVTSTDPLGEFINYEVFQSIGIGPFINVANLSNRLQNSYNHINANFGLPSTFHRYYLVAAYNDGAIKRTVTSDTLVPISPILTVNQNVSGQLVWNPIKTPALPSSGASYSVDRRFSVTPPNWANGIAAPNIGNELFTDNVARCDDEVFYKVRLQDNSGCESVSAIVSAPLIKSGGPAPMGFTSISVNKEFGYTELFWDKHPEPETIGYIIFYIDANGNELDIDTVFGNTFSYKDLNAARPAFLATQCYRIAPVDSCAKTQGAVITHCTMHLTRTFDPCEAEVSLNWTPYEGWDNGTEIYEIYMSINNGPFVLNGSVNGSVNSYIIPNISAINTYSFYISAYSKTGGYISNSNLLGTKFNLVDKTQHIRLRSATIKENTAVAINLLVDRRAVFDHIALYRAHSEEGPYQKIRRFIPDSRVDSFLTIEDTIPLQNHLKAFYYAIVIDECNKPVVKSNIISTIFLEAKGDKYDFETELKWNLVIISDSIEQVRPAYYAYYGMNKQLQANHFASTRSLTTLDHPFEGDAIYSNEFCYRIELIQQESELYPKQDSSYSNMECFLFEPEIHIPNAFSPNNDGVNEVWKPEIIYGESGAGYLLQIFDEWGKVMFETDDPNKGWDGKHNSEPSRIGSYIYKFKVLTYLESEIHRKGSFTLVR